MVEADIALLPRCTETHSLSHATASMLRCAEASSKDSEASSKLHKLRSIAAHILRGPAPDPAILPAFPERAE
jgi:hypothetical protein